MTELYARCGNLEKSKQRLKTDIDDLHIELDRSNQKSNILERRANNFDKIVLEWKTKADDLRLEVEEGRKEIG